MRNRFMLLLTFFAALAITSPALAGPSEDAKAEETKAPDAKAPDAKAPDAKAEETKAPDAKAEEAKAEEPDEATEEEAKAEDGPAEIKDDEEAVSVMKELVAAAKGGQWGLVAAFGIMLLVYLIHRFGLAAKIGKKFIPWVAAATGILGYVAAALLVGGASITDAVTGGIMTGAAAVGLWELLFKHFMKGKETPEPEMESGGSDGDGDDGDDDGKKT